MGAEAYLRFYEELNDYLPAQKRKREFAFPLGPETSVSRMLETLQVPVSAIEFVLINGSSVDLSRFLAPGDHVSIYPVFESFDVRPLLRLRGKPLRRTRFVVDSGLRRLAFYLRLFGYEASAGSRIQEGEEDRRILLTTDPALMKSGLPRVFLVTKRRPGEQLKEVLARFDLLDSLGTSPLKSAMIRLLANGPKDA